MKPILFILSGLPASGKSTLAKLIAKEYNAFYLRIDTIEQALRDLCDLDVQGEGYRLAYQIANDNLDLKHHVVADSCNPINLTRQEWEGIAIQNECIYINIEVMCSNNREHQKRCETRYNEIAELQLPTWNEIRNREYNVWEKDHIKIDTANKSVEDCFSELKKKIARHLEDNK
jgi:predicted kinase